MKDYDWIKSLRHLAFDTYNQIHERPPGDAAVIIDLSGVPFMDSAGLGALIGGIRKIREAEGEVVVVCDRPAVLRLLHTTRFDRMVTVVALVDDAHAELATPSS